MDTLFQTASSSTKGRLGRTAVVVGIVFVALFGGFIMAVAGRGSTGASPSPTSQAASGRPYAFSDQAGANAPASLNAGPARSLGRKSMAHSPANHTGASGNGGLPSDIIKTADLTIKVGHKKALGASQDATAIADGLGGYVSYRNSYNHNTDIELQVRIPAQSFDFALRQIRKLGTVESESDNTQDVTLQVVDLGARLKNLEAQRNELLSLYSKAKTVADTIRVQNVLSNVQGQVEQTQAQMRYLANQTTLATISLSFEAKPVKHHHHHVVSSKIGNAFGSAGNGIISVVAGAIVVVGYALPLAGLMFLGYGAFALIRRMYLWRRGSRTVTAAPAV